MKTVGIIPSRYNSSRFPGKPLVDIAGRPMIQWVYENACKADLFNSVYVATDNQKIYDCVNTFGGRALITNSNHTCGTDRLAECVDILALDDEDIVLNIQGDEPLIDAEMISDLRNVFNDEGVYMGTLMKLIEKKDELVNPNVVKVIVDANSNAIYFSRYCLPYERNSQSIEHYKHIGIYGYKVWFLKKFSKLPKGKLEVTESLEQLRVIENGYKIRVAKTRFQSIGVDTPEQLIEVENEIIKRGMM